MNDTSMEFESCSSGYLPIVASMSPESMAEVISGREENIDFIWNPFGALRSAGA